MAFDQLTAFLDSLKEQYGIPGYDIIITRGHETVYRHTGGHSDYEGCVPVNGSELYYIYSATKVITMTAAMQLIQAAKMGLDDPVSRYLPEYAQMQVADRCQLGIWPPDVPTLKDPHHPARTPITLRMLMAMTAGLNYDISGEPIRKMKEATGNRATTREMVGAIAEMPLCFEPGTRWSYCLGHDVIAAVIEVVSGMRFSEYLARNIFEPLGIREMYFHPTEAQRARLMAQYLAGPQPGQMKPVPQENSFCLSECYESGGAGICCSAEAYSTDPHPGRYCPAVGEPVERRDSSRFPDRLAEGIRIRAGRAHDASAGDGAVPGRGVRLGRGSGSLCPGGPCEPDQHLLRPGSAGHEHRLPGGPSETAGPDLQGDGAGLKGKRT